jgi:hypothetical protein
MAGRLNKQTNKCQECNLWYFSQFKLGMGIQKQTDHVCRPWRIPTDRDVYHQCVWLDGYVSDGW